ncbi:MAG: hypothetical protein MHM6MM_000750, partial [Cercozoa sp. M6MM]
MRVCSMRRAVSLRFRRFSSEALQYQRLSQREHVLHRPEMYLGAVAVQESELPVLDESGVIRRKQVSVVPAEFKIFDEILVNAADNATRAHFQQNGRKKQMTFIRVDFDTDTGEITILNDGPKLPVVKHEEEGMYVPTLVFGRLLTSSNYNDTEERYVGGRHGYGAKLTNLFSSSFTVECFDRSRKLLFQQTWKNNMAEEEEPVITKVKFDPLDDLYRELGVSTRKQANVEGWTRVSYTPDRNRFGNLHNDDDMRALLRRRVLDVAACHPSVAVFLDGEQITVPVDSSPLAVYAARCEELREAVEAGKMVDTTLRGKSKWSIGVAASKDGHFLHNSFVNGVATHRGGKHVKTIVKQVADAVIQHLKSTFKVTVTQKQVERHLHILVSGWVPNPSFDTQSKDFLLTETDDVVLSQVFLKNIIQTTDVVSRIMGSEGLKEEKALKKLTKAPRNKINIPKLQDAEVKGKNAVLILTEGDSAKALAVAGLSGLTKPQRKRFGIMPLRGKVLNVRKATAKKLEQNAEVRDLINALGLKFGVDYSPGATDKRGRPTTDSLRYGRLMLMCDQDADGSHIKGLVLNVLHKYFPGLLRSRAGSDGEWSFVEQFVTPLVKAIPRKGSAKSKQERTLSFYSGAEFEDFVSKFDNQKEKSPEHGRLRDWTIKYYKGLGTSTAEEARAYFSDLGKHRIRFIFKDEKDLERIDLAFNTDADTRKLWLKEFSELPIAQRLNTLEATDKEVSYGSFVDGELRTFSALSNVRAIPSVFDGLKPSQRKILYACLRRHRKGQTGEIKVAQLAAHVAETTSYHHGEVALQNAIVAMAQDFLGSNNVPLLQPIGQFGTRHQVGKDAASPRYIFTKLSPVTLLLFR